MYKMPGVRCGSCSKFMSPVDGAKCNTLYHRLCVAIPQTGMIASWRCCDCQKRVTKGTLSAVTNSPDIKTPGVADTIVSDLESELRCMRDELRTVRDEFRAFREEMAEFRALKGRVDSLERRLDVLEQSNTNKTSIDPNFEEIVSQLKRDLNTRDQELLTNDVEITNLPENAGESVIHTVKLIATKLGVSLEDRDIVGAERVGSRHLSAVSSAGPAESRPRPIVVRLARRDLRDALYKGARVRRGTTTADLGLSGHPRRFYVNERLTKVNRMLFRQAREAGQEKGWRFVWTDRGRILARRKDGDAACRIYCEDDIHRIFGCLVKNV